MRRKETQLETNLIDLGYKLSHKTYCGKKSEKVDEYIFLKQNRYTIYQVSIDRTREHINSFSFVDRSIALFNDNSIEELQDINNKFHEEMELIYDFENKVAKKLENPFDLDVEEIDPPFVEESVFDDND